MNIENVTWIVSNEAKELVKSGKAKFSTGGIRLLDGTLKELAIPIIQSSTNELSAPPIISNSNSYTPEMLAKLIKDETKVTHNQLNDILNKSTSLCNTIVLPWANTAINLANCGLSFVYYKKQTKLFTYYFEEQNKQINTVIELLKDIKEHIEYIDNRNRSERIKYYLHQADSDISELFNQTNMIETDRRQLTSFLNEFSAFIESLISDYDKGTIDNDYYVESIFLLASLFAKEVELFSLQYYHITGMEPKNYPYWNSVISRIDNCDSLKERTKSIIMLQFPNVSPIQKRDYYKMLNLTFANHYYNLEIDRYLEKKLEINTSQNDFEDIINNKILNGEPLRI